MKESPSKRTRILPSASDTLASHLSHDHDDGSSLPHASLTAAVGPTIHSTPRQQKSEFLVHLSPDTPNVAAFNASRHKQPILATADVSLGNGEVTFRISSTRPATSLSSGQGDHVTAFATFIELLYNSTHNKENADEIIAGLRKIINALFSQEVIRDFEGIDTKFTTDQSKLLSRDSRKILTGFIRGSSGTTLRASDSTELRMDSEFVSQVKTSLKYAEVSYIASFIVQTGSELISKLNSLEDMSFAQDPSASRERQKEAQGTQGGTVKQALYTLRLINLLKTAQDLRVSGNSTKFDSLMTDISSELTDSNSPLKQGLKNILKNMLGEEFSDRALTPYLEDNRRMMSLLDTQPNLIAATVGQKVSKLFDFKYQDGRQLDKLCQLLSRHLAIVFNTFAPLKSYMQDEPFFNIVMANFVGEEVIEKQGWKNFSSETTPHALYTSIVNRIKDKRLINLEDFTLTDYCKLKTTVLSSSDHRDTAPTLSLSTSRRAGAVSTKLNFSSFRSEPLQE